MKCPHCQNPIIIGFNECVVCQKDNLSSEPVPAKYFVGFCSIALLIISLFQPINSLNDVFKICWVSLLGGLIWGSILWLFYGIFRRGHSH
jgi:hypothetical protein